MSNNLPESQEFPDKSQPAPETPPPAVVSSPPLGWSSAASTTPTNSPGAALGDSSAAGPDSPPSSAPKLAPPSNETGSSPASSPGSATARKHLEEVLVTVIDAATTFAHQFATDEIGKEVGLWLADEQDKTGIAQPGSKILSRRGVLDGATSDVSDGIQLLIAVGGYVSKQLTQLAHIRRARKAAATFPGEPVQQAPDPA